jgi:hypothetical protein
VGEQCRTLLLHPIRARSSRVFVIFTDYSGTLAALQMADRLTKKFEACLRLLRPYEGPYAVPLTAPSVSAEFLEEQLRAWASKIAMHTVAHIYLCRDKRRGVRLILKPGSIVILGGRRGGGQRSRSWQER